MSETTGTPNPEGGDAGEQTQTTGTPETDGRDATQDAAALREQLLQNKLDREEFNKTKEELASLRAQLSERQNTASNDPDDEEKDPDEDGFRKQIELGDPTSRRLARLEKRLAEREERLARAVLTRFELQEIEDKSLRERAKEHLVKNRHRGIDLKAAVAEVAAADMNARIQQLERELSAASKKPPAGTVATHTREVPASEIKKREATSAEITQRAHALRMEGKGMEALKLETDVLNGEIKLTG